MTKEPITINVLDHGYITLHDWMGDDLRIINMARQSFGKESEKIGESEKGLINFLLKNRHGTPLEGVVFTFNVKCPIFVARQWMRHRICSYNEYSGRYSEMLSDFYIPEIANIRKQKGKRGNYSFKSLPGGEAALLKLRMRDKLLDCWEAYKYMLSRGVAKEIARIILPVNIYTKFTWVINLRSLFNFISLRSAENAMWEIRQYSQAIEELIRPIVPITYKAFNENGRISP